MRKVNHKSNLSLSRFAVCKALVMLLLVFCQFTYSQDKTFYTEDVNSLSGLENLYIQNEATHIVSPINKIDVVKTMLISKVVTNIINKELNHNKDTVNLKIAKLIKSNFFNQQKLDETQLNFASTPFSKYYSLAVTYNNAKVKFILTSNNLNLSTSNLYYDVSNLCFYSENSFLMAQNNYLFCRPPPIA